MIAWVREWVFPLMAGVLIVLLGIAALTAVLISRNSCVDEVISEEPSPGGHNIAVVMQRSCGTTTPVVYHVNLRSMTHKFSRHWSGTITDGEVFRVARVAARADWLGDDQLQVTCKDLSHARKKSSSWQQVRIVYSDGSSANPAASDR
jgi:hypothetical protein